MLLNHTDEMDVWRTQIYEGITNLIHMEWQEREKMPWRQKRAFATSGIPPMDFDVSLTIYIYIYREIEREREREREREKERARERERNRHTERNRDRGTEK